MKSFRQSFRRKKKNQDVDNLKNEDSRLDTVSVHSFSTPQKGQHTFLRRTFSSVRISHSDNKERISKRVSKLSRSFRSSKKLAITDSGAKVGDSGSKPNVNSPVYNGQTSPITSKNELITNSRPLPKIHRDSTNPFEDEPVDQNFVLDDKSSCDLEDTNPFAARRALNMNGNGDTPASSISRSKRFRKNVKKTFSRIGSVRKKKDPKNLSCVEINVEESSNHERLAMLSKEDQLRNLYNSKDSIDNNLPKPVLNTPVIMRAKNSTATLPAKTGTLSRLSALKSPYGESAEKFEIINEELAYQMIEIQVSVV